MPRPLRDLHLDKRGRLSPVEAFAQVLRERRLELGLTQSDLENDETLDRSYISKLELAKREVGLVAFIHLAGKLRLEPWELMREVVERMGA
jgi:transcriptional regulator with XRE-family HTH domain